MIKETEIQSSVDWADIENNELYIRDKKLSSLIGSSDFTEMIFHTWLNKKATKNEKKMLNAVLVSFSGGWSFFPPSVMSSRLAASTKAPIGQCLAAGFCSTGPAHAGAIEKAMEIFLDKNNAEETVEKMLANGNGIPGFGHPMVKKDPRPDLLRDIAKELDISGKGLENYDRIAKVLLKEKNISPNIDGINGAILVDLGFRNPAFGPAIFLLGRSLTITAHIIEEYQNPPFHMYKIIMPSYKKVRYTGKEPGWDSENRSE